MAHERKRKIEQLRNQIADLEAEERKEQRPKPVDSPNLAKLVVAIESYFTELEGSHEVDDDTEHYIFEEAVTALYGPGIFDWINKHL
jgi:hypothetical protein